eukprot:COSAG01_NODE_9650_length_2380_cov_5.391057_3_plen_116_part_00
MEAERKGVKGKALLATRALPAASTATWRRTMYTCASQMERGCLKMGTGCSAPQSRVVLPRLGVPTVTLRSVATDTTTGIPAKLPANMDMWQWVAAALMCAVQMGRGYQVAGAGAG